MNPSLSRSFLTGLAAFAIGLPSAFAQYTERVSVDSSGLQGNSQSWDPCISSDGRFVAFASFADNLRGASYHINLFVHDRQTGQTTQVSVDSGGRPRSNGDSEHPSVSSDGRFVAFDSVASNLVPGDTNGYRDVFVRDQHTGQTTRVSVDSGGVQGNDWSRLPSISSDGRFVAFESQDGLVPGDTNHSPDIFVHDRQMGQTTRVSVDSRGTIGNRGSSNPAISSDGRFVAFHSHATNLVMGDTNGQTDAFVHDRQTGQTTRVSIDSAGLQANDYSYSTSISSDGRFVAFHSRATNLVIGDTNGHKDAFVHDRQTGQTTRVSVASGGGQGNAASNSPRISSDGRFVAFSSVASNLAPGDTNGRNDAFVHDRQTGQTTLVNVNSAGIQGNRDSGGPTISSDGRFVAFRSAAGNLVHGDTNRADDIFVHDRRSIMPTLAAQSSCPGLMTFTLDAATPEGGVAFALGAAGTFTLTSSVCAGTILDIANPQLGPVIRASWLGTIERTYQIAPAMCGLTVQAVDIHTCRTSNAVVL